MGKTIHASEEIFGYCQVHDLHQSQINKTALQLYTDETLMTESVKFFVQVIMSNGVTMFYLALQVIKHINLSVEHPNNVVENHYYLKNYLDVIY